MKPKFNPTYTNKQEVYHNIYMTMYTMVLSLNIFLKSITKSLKNNDTCLLELQQWEWAIFWLVILRTPYTTLTLTFETYRK